MIYLDSSVVLARLLTEPRHAPDALWAQALFSSRLLQYEVWNRIHASELTGELGEQARALLDRVDLVELSSAVLERALEPFRVRVRTLDAMHLATIDFLRSEGQAVELASYDKRMLAAAHALGLPLYQL